MPMQRGSSKKVIAANIAELHGGETYSRTAATHGKSTANKQAVAIAMKEAGKSKAKKKRKRTIAEGY